MLHQLTPSQENYLEHILNMSTQRKIRVKDLAGSVGVKLPSVTRAVQKLVDIGMVRHESYGKIEITKAGRKVALSVKRRNRCLKRLLVDILQMNPQQAENEVCRIEHLISDDVLNRLEILVDYLSASENLTKKIINRLERQNADNIALRKYNVGEYQIHT